MFILEEPYVSDFLAQRARELGLPVLDTPMARKALGPDAALTPGPEFARLARAAGSPAVYANSENAIPFVETELAGTDLPRSIASFKDKVAFRELLRPLYPDFAFTGATLQGLDAVDLNALPKPFIIKPAVGFMSLGVRKVMDEAQWPDTVRAIRAEAAAVKGMFPDQVLNTGRFVLEACIPGQEFAVDAYFDDAGRPVILNVLAHHFASAADVSDRAYVTSGQIIRQWRGPMLEVLAELGERAGLRRFPVHAELRADESGRLHFIEVNPMRFAGWCCTDIAYYAYGIDPYGHFMAQTEPDWDQVLSAHAGKAYGLVVAEIDPAVDRSTIRSVDWDGFGALFAEPLQIRPVDYHRYSVFAFVFTQMDAADQSELTRVLQADLKPFLDLG